MRVPGTPWTNNLASLSDDTSAYNVIPWHVKATLGMAVGRRQVYQGERDAHFNYGYINSSSRMP